MHMRRSGTKIRIELNTDEAVAVGEDLGGIQASQISVAGDELHGLLESAMEFPEESR